MRCSVVCVVCKQRHNLFAAMRDEREARGDFHVACRCSAAKCLPVNIVNTATVNDNQT
jgi:hypothetical protein